MAELYREYRDFPVDPNAITWKHTILGMKLFLLAGGSLMLWDVSVEVQSHLYYVKMGVFVGVFLWICMLAGVAWSRHFPRWSYPYIGHGIVFSFFLMQVRILPWPSFGWYAWIPFGGIFLLALLQSLSFKPILSLLDGIWEDWTKASFALFGGLPMVVYLFLNGVPIAYKLPLMIQTTLILLIGSFLYMRSPAIWQRAFSLLGIAWLCLLIAVIGAAFYQSGQKMAFFPYLLSGNVFQTDLFATSLVVMGAILSPLCIGLLHTAAMVLVRFFVRRS